MKWILFGLSLFWITAGSWVILYTNQSRDGFKAMVDRLGRIPLGAGVAVLGVLVILAARGSYNAGFIVFLGLLALVKGALIVWNPRGLYEKTVQWGLAAASDQSYRLAGIVMLVLGTALLSWIVH